MAIGTALAIAGATIGGSILSSSSQKKAANKAADTSMQVAQQNNALAQNIYNQNKAALNPYTQRGNAAGDAINSLLGLGGAPQQQQTPGMSGGYTGFQGDIYTPQNVSENMYDYGGGGMLQNYGGANALAASPPSTPQQDYNQAFQNYQNSTGYKFRLGEGVNALDASASARGVRNSGAAMKSLTQYGQNIGSAEFGNYLAQLANQQGVGLSGASAQAGVGQNYVNNVTANNNNAGTAAANAALAKGQANANMWGGIANGIGGIFGSSFG